MILGQKAQTLVRIRSNYIIQGYRSIIVVWRSYQDAVTLFVSRITTRSLYRTRVRLIMTRAPYLGLMLFRESLISLVYVL